MMNSLTKRVLSWMLLAVMLIGLLPMGAFATEATDETTTPAPASEEAAALISEDGLDVNEYGLPGYMTVIQNDQYTLAPGITERQIAAYDANGDRVEMLVAEADVSVDTVKIYANYLNNQNLVYGMQKTTDQAACFEANHPDEKVIVAINASYFNTSTGKPTGTFVMEGIDVTNEAEGNNYSFFALLKDGTYMIGAKGEYSAYKGQIQEAIGGYIHLVKDGEICSGLNKIDKYPRQTIGITADGRVLVMTSDGNQAPKSIGLTVQEQAEVMLALGCVEALHLDGGGSATYCSKPEGSDNLQVVNSPSNGSERTVSSTLIFVSTAKPDGTFDRAALAAEYNYVTPGNTVAISATGIDAAGGAAEVPADVTWQLKDSAFGTVTNGVFTSNGTVGAAVVQLVYGGTVVGETTINVVNPDSLNFGGRESIVVPFGQSADLNLKALSGVNEVAYAASDFEVKLADENAGFVNGLTVTAPAADSGISGTTLTVSLKSNPAISASIALIFGKGSEVVFSFEEGTAGANMDNWILRTHESDSKSNEHGEVYIVNSETGMVHSGEQALAFHTDFSQTTGQSSNTGGYLALSLSWGGDPVDIKGAQTLGFWLYVPEDAMSTEVTMNVIYYDANGTPQRRTVDGFDDNGESIYTPYWGENMEESGWHYVRVDLSNFANDLLIKDEPALSQAYKRNFFIKIYCVFGAESENFADFCGDFTYYIDDITVDYSDAVADRALPVFGNVYAYGSGSEKQLTYGTVTDVSEGDLVFSAYVTDNMTAANYSGLNVQSAKAYVDGNPVGAAYNNGMISTESVSLTNGTHTIRFEIEDNNGNSKTIVRTVKVNGSNGAAAVQLVPRDASLDRLLSGSVYWVDLVAEDIANIQSVKALLDLNSINNWELEHMVVADGFDVSYISTAAQAAEKDIVLNVTRNGEEVDESSNVIVSIPIRVWDYHVHEYPGHEGKTPLYMWKNQAVNIRGLRVEVDQGLVTFTDDTTESFHSSIDVSLESYCNYYAMDKDYYNAKLEAGGYHSHTAAPVDDKAATCTEDGYTGRTFCEVCDSVVVWGTKVPANGHTYELIDGVLKCGCGETFTGTWEDGKDYVDGVAVSDGWNGDYYYVGGVKLTGVQKVAAPDSTDEFYYNFGEDGVCKGKYEGLFLDETASVYRYAKLGVLTSGWQTIDDEWYYFDPATLAAATGTVQYTNDITYEFDETGKITKGCWVKTLYGTRYYYGPAYHKTDWLVVDGNTYFFQNGYRLEGYRLAREYNSQSRNWYNFGEDGILVDEVIPDGFYDDAGNGYSYVKDGVALAGENVIDGVYYYFDWKGYAKTGYQAGRLYGNDYKAITGIIDDNGVLRYYRDGKPNMGGMVEVDGAYYFAYGDNGEVAVNETRYVWQGNGIVPESNREFGADGKLLDGIVEKDGTLYYYDMGQGVTAGMVEVDGAYYFAYGENGEIAANEIRYVWQGNGIVTESECEFGADGKLLDGIVQKEDGYYYYVMGQPKVAGLIYVDGHYYFAKGEGKLATGKYYVWQSNDLLPEANYIFAEDGKMLDGIVEKEDGLYYYVNGMPKMAGLIEFDGALYFAGGEGKLVTGRTYYVWQGNGILPESNREFGADGKMLDGIVEQNGVLYHYVDGQRKMSGMVEIDGAYYFAYGANGEVAVNETRYVWQGNGIVPESNREFGADGKLLDGIIEKDGQLYYYVMGQPKMAGMIELDGAYYFVYGANGEVAADETRYVWQGNGIVPESSREFDAEGKLLDGIVEKADGYYYYEMGVAKMAGLIYIDGYYYFAGAEGKLVTNRTYYVWMTNGLTMEMNYTFDALGRIVL